MVDGSYNCRLSGCPFLRRQLLEYPWGAFSIAAVLTG